jgi:hypothetical protein
MFSRRWLCSATLTAAALSVLSCVPAAAVTYNAGIALNVPVQIGGLPTGTTAVVGCLYGEPIGPYVAQVPVPLTFTNGIGSYSGTITVVFKPPTPAQSGDIVSCLLQFNGLGSLNASSYPPPPTGYVWSNNLSTSPGPLSQKTIP